MKGIDIEDIFLLLFIIFPDGKIQIEEETEASSRNGIDGRAETQSAHKKFTGKIRLDACKFSRIPHRVFQFLFI